MHVSREDAAESEARLRKVIARAHIEWLAGEFGYYEHGLNDFPVEAVADAIAFVRDAEIWSVLRPASGHADELFSVFRVHFASGLDNSGFVGWLATAFKRELGTGVFVVCGQNTRRGGIFDYWGVPLALREQAMRFLDEFLESCRGVEKH